MSPRNGNLRASCGLLACVVLIAVSAEFCSAAPRKNKKQELTGIVTAVDPVYITIDDGEGSGVTIYTPNDYTDKVYTGISFLASRRLRGYTCLPPVWPSAHNIFPQMVPLVPFRPSGVLKTNALPASGSVFSDTAACRGSLRINFSAAKAELPRGHWQPSNPPHHRRKQPPCQMALRQQ